MSDLVAGGAQIIGGIQSYNLARKEAGMIEQAGGENARQITRQAQQQAGAQRAIMAGAGVVSTEGSPAEVVMEDLRENLHQANVARWNAQVQAKIRRFQAKQALVQGIAGGTASILRGGGKAAAAGGF